MEVVRSFSDLQEICIKDVIGGTHAVSAPCQELQALMHTSLLHRLTPELPKTCDH